jgi:RNA polymerase-binding transcription factor DksA
VVSKKGGYEMEAKNLAVLRNEIFTRVRSILYERYGEFVPDPLIENESQGETVVKAIKRVESFKADEDLLDLFEALEKVFSGRYGYCLFCRKEIEFSKLMRNPLAKFCDSCERILNPNYVTGDAQSDEKL